MITIENPKSDPELTLIPLTFPDPELKLNI